MKRVICDDFCRYIRCFYLFLISLLILFCYIRHFPRIHIDEILKDIRQLQNDGAKYDWELKQLQWLHPELKVQPPEANPHPFKSTDLNLDMNPGKVPDVTKQNQ